MKYILLSLTLLVSPLLVGQSAEKHTAPKTQQIVYEASPRPDRIILSWAENNSASQAVTWRTDVSIMEPVAQLAAVSSDVDFYRTPETYEASSEKVVAFDEVVKYHTVNFTELEPNKYYAYRVGGDGYWSEWIQFKSAPAKETAFSFIYMGDAQNDVFPLWSRVVREAFIQRPKAAFMLHSGDLINHAQNNYEWGEWFSAMSFISGMMPQIIAAGNHEYVKDEDGEKTGISSLYHPQFNFPENGLPQLGPTNYFLDYSNLRVIVMNTNDELKEQADWLREVLETNEKRWVVVSFHHPIISGAEGRENEGIMKYWKPVLDKYKVDLVLQGHDHVYGRGRALDGDRSKNAGPVFVVSVSGRKMYSLSDHPWMERKAANKQFYQIIDINDDVLQYRAYTTDNILFDGFELKKTGKNTKFRELKE